MARRIETITELYEQAVRKVTESPESWTDFLCSACRNYKCTFDELLLIHEQRPDATAVLTIEDWNNIFGRWVNRGATSIAVFDRQSGNKTDLKHYFDISDTHKTQRARRDVPLWEMKPEYEAAVTETLESAFGELENKGSFAGSLISAAKNAVEDNLPDYLADLMLCRADSFLEELDELNVAHIYGETVKNSMAYMLLTRCGIDANTYFDREDFLDVFNFNTPDTINALGVATGDIAKTALLEISSTVLQMTREEKKPRRTFAENENRIYDKTIETERSVEYGDNIQHEERIQSAGARDAGRAGGDLGKIRHDAAQLSGKAPQSAVHEFADIGQADGASGRDRTDSERARTTDGRENGESRGRDRGTESSGSDEMGGADEQPYSLGRGDSSKRADIQLIIDQAIEAESAKLPAFLVEEDIFEILRYDEYMPVKRPAIAAYFSSHKKASERADFVKRSYNIDVFSEVLIHPEKKRVGYIAKENGLTMWEGGYLSRTSESTFSWDVVQKFIADLISRDAYLDQQPAMQLNLFGEVAGTPKRAGKQSPVKVVPPAPMGISQQLIDEVLCDGGNERNSTLRICAYFKCDRPLADNVGFLKEEYKTGGKGFIVDGIRAAAWFDESGIRIAQGETAIESDAAVLLSWEQTAKRIRELLDLGRYMPQADFDRVDRNERKEIAEKIWYLDQDCTNGVNIIDRPDGFRGFPEETAYLAGQLSDIEQLKSFRDKIADFAEKYEQNRELLRFHFHKPRKLLERMDGLLGPRLFFASDMVQSEESKKFITQDEIDYYLTGDGLNMNSSKFRTYSFFLEEHTAKEKADFLKDGYGISGSVDQVRNMSSSGKGLSISRESIISPYAKVELKWSAVAKRIDALIASGRYMSERELAHIPEYEKDELARHIGGFFQNKRDCVKPYAEHTNLLDVQEVIRPQLDDANRVREIIGMMQDVMDSMAHEDARYEHDKKAYDDLVAFSEGRYTLFGNKGTLPEKENESAPEEKEYILQMGATVYLGGKEYEIYSFDDAQVRLIDPEVPLLVEEMPRSVFEARLADDRRNDLLLSDQKEEQPQSLNGESDLPESMAGEVEIFPEDVEQPVQEQTVEYAEQQLETLTPVWEKPAPKRSFERLPKKERIDYRITDDALGAGGPKERFKNNIAAIELLVRLEQEDRLAAPEEQEILAKYVGWGGLASAFDPDSADWHSEYRQLKEVLSEEEYASARESTLTAFYTPPVVIRAMYDALRRMGLKNANVLEPSCGIGHFFGMLPEDMRDCKLYGVEIDSISGRIAKQLYQNANILVQGYENTDIPDSFFDAAIGNVPFGDFKVADKRYDKLKYSIHDYYFAKTLDKVRPGGVIAFITSSFTMDKENPAVRRYIAQRAELLGAVRLPNNTFKASAGTEVTTDILFLQKRDRLIDLDETWTQLGRDENGISMNAYFIDHPEMVLGNMVMESTRFGPAPACQPIEGEELSTLLRDALANIHAQIPEQDMQEQEDASIPAEADVRNFSFTIHDGRTYYRENSRMTPCSFSVTGENRVRGLIAIRDCARRLIEYQTEEYPDDTIRKEQAKLNRLYDDFTEKYGLISGRANSAVFSSDSSFPLMTSLEIIGDNGELERKADIFFKRTIRPNKTVTHTDTASEALAVSLAEKAKVDMAYMSQLMGKSEEELYAELKGVIFLNPMFGYGSSREEQYLSADEYLSGNVREKLLWARRSAQQNPEEYALHVEALEKVQPKDLTASEISVRLGTTWLPPGDIEQFIFELLDTPRYSRYRIKVHYSKYTGEWNIEGKSVDAGNIKALSTFGTRRMNAYRIIETTLNLREAMVYDYHEDESGRRVPKLNKKETAIAQSKQELLRQAFVDWIWKDPERRQRLTRYYNDTFNAHRDREYDGSHLRFPGMNPEIALRAHQVNAVARTIYSGKNSLYAHVVGAGKTFTIVAAAQEMKRLGLCHKSMIVVPNHLTEQWAAEYMQLYPAANILVTTKKDFETKNRKRFCARIATGDYDAVIIGHSQFEKIPVSYGRQVFMLQKQIEDITAGIAEAKRMNGERFTVKQLEKTKKTLKARLDKLNNQDRKDDVVTFEELGVDRLFVDEADNYKNLFLHTKMRNVGGIAQTEAQKSSDMYMKCRYMDELTGRRGVIFATGTPVSNSMVELYTMQRYLQYDLLSQRSLQHFDAWASTFGETVTAIELAPEGYTLIGR